MPIKPNSKRVPRKQEDPVNAFQEQLVNSLKSTETVYVHNISNTEYHLAPSSQKLTEVDGVTKFDVNEVRAFAPEDVNHRHFKEAFLKKKLRVVTEEQYEEILRSASKNAKRSGKKSGGLNASGLPNTSKRALDIIYECEDIDELEAWLELEDREEITASIEKRIEDLEDDEFGNPRDD